MQWKNVYVFISSTFNDMHAERDHLVKRVFPELRRWCAQRKLKLMDIDLRWGVSEADALENKRVVEVCMRNIDRCRPFFLCFLGQRRGWVPGQADVNPDTLANFPELQQYLGKRSVTELEILHALIHPLDGHSAPVSHARFYFRSNDYLKSLSSEHAQHFCPKKSFLSGQDRELEQFKKQLSKQYPAVTYTSTWNPTLPSPELSGALSIGRLENFRVGQDTLENDVLTWLRDQIAQEFPDHMVIDPPEGSLEQELERQDTQLFQSYDGYISRPAEEDAIDRLLEVPDHRPLVLLAEAGCGKTSLLAHLIHRYRDQRRVYYRFLGTTPHSFHLSKLSASLVRQWIADGLLSESEGNYTEQEMQIAFPHLLKTAAANAPFLLVLDGMDQLLGQADWRSWLPRQLPEGSDVLVSLRAGSCQTPDNCRIHRLGLMTDREDRIQMVRSYLSAFFKDVDDRQLERILDMGGSSNPLFMKIVLNELRQHGSFDTLLEILQRDYGSTPLDAFRQVLLRVGKELTGLGYGDEAVTVFLGCLACAQSGMDGQMIADAAGCVVGWDRYSVRQLKDTVYALARELEPFFVLDGDRIAIRYDSLRRAILQDYSSQLIQYIHSMLAVAFGEKAGRDRSPENYTLALHHLTHATEQMIDVFFANVPVLLKCIQLCSTQLLTDTCDVLAQERHLESYQKLGNVLRKAAARLDTHPQTLFAELRRFGDVTDPVIGRILEKETDLQPQYLQPLSPPGLLALVDAEYALPRQSQDVEYAAPYLLILQKDRLWVVDAQSRKTVNLLYLETSADSYTKYHVSSDGITLYLSRWDNNSNLKGWTQYALPELEVLQEGGADCPDGALWSLRVANGRLYGLFQKHHKGAGVDTHLADLHTGQVLFSHTSQRSCNTYFLQDLAMVHDLHSGLFQLVRITDGQVLLRDTFLGTAHAIPGHTLDGSANIYGAQGKFLYLWLSGAKSKNGALLQLVQLRKYAFRDNSLELVAQAEPKASCSNLQLLDERYLVAESSGRIAFLDTDLQLLGFQDLGSDVSGTQEWSGGFHLIDENTVAAFHAAKIQFFPLSGLLASLHTQKRDAAYISYDTFVRDGQFYVLSPQMQRTDLTTLETVTEVSKIRQNAMTYTPWNIPYTPILAGTGFMAGGFCIKDTQAMELLLQSQYNNQNSKLLHAFTYHHSGSSMSGDVWAGLVVADAQPVMRIFQGKEQPFLQCRLLTQSVQNLTRHYPWYQTQLDILVADGKHMHALPTFVAMEQDGFLVFPNAYSNEQEVAVKVYDLALREVIYSKNVMVTYGFQTTQDLYYIHGGFLLSMPSKEQPKFLHMDLRDCKAYIGERNGAMVKPDPFATHVFFYNSRVPQLECYDLSTHKMDRVIHLTDRKRLSVQQALLLDGWLILRELLSDTLEVYDYSTGKKLFDQRMESVMESLTPDPETKTLCMFDPSNRTTFWQTHP